MSKSARCVVLVVKALGGYKANNPCEDLAVGVQSLAEVEVWGLELEEFEGRENRAVAVQRHSHDVRFASRTITLASGNTGKEQPSLLAWYASHSQSDSAGLGSYRALGPQEKSESVSCSVQSNSLQPHEPGCSVRGILQARILEWVAMPSSRGCGRPRDGTRISNVSCTGRRVLYHWTHNGINTTVVVGVGVQLLSWVWGRVQRRLAEPPAALEEAPRPWSVPLGERGPETQGARAHNLPVWTHVPLAGASTSRHHHGAGGSNPVRASGSPEPLSGATRSPFSSLPIHPPHCRQTDLA